MTPSQELREHALYDNPPSMWRLRGDTFHVVLDHGGRDAMRNLTPIMRRMFFYFIAEALENT